MELDSFINEVLTQISRGIEQANNEPERKKPKRMGSGLAITHTA